MLTITSNLPVLDYKCLQYPDKAKGFKLKDFQEKEKQRGISLLSQGNSAILIAPTGSGKTFYLAEILGSLREQYPDKYPSHQSILILTANSVVTQTRRVMHQRGVKNVIVSSYDSIRSSFGAIFLEWKTRIVNQEPIEWPVWRPITEMGLRPALIVCDECQKTKNDASLQSRFIDSWIEINGQILFASATPASRPSHTRRIVTALGLCTPKGFPSWIARISAPHTPEEYSPAAMRRICEAIEPYTIRFHDIKYEHQCRIRQLLITPTPHQFAIISAAMEEYQETRRKADRGPLTGFAEILVAIAKLRQKSEVVRAPDLATLGLQDMNEYKNVIIACAFKESLAIIHTLLTTKHGISDNKIAIIMGGQSEKERQKNIDEFQSERRNICLLMLQAGGAGLSLHHTPDNKRQRVVYLPPVWNAEELVQVLGRAHRCNSQSITYQHIVWYAGTIEERIAQKVKIKCRSLKEMVGRRETWCAAFDENATAQESPRALTLHNADDEEERCVELDASEDLPVDPTEEQ